MGSINELFGIFGLALETIKGSASLIFDTLQLNMPTAGQYTLTFRNGTKYIFSGNNLNTTVNQSARLDMIEDPHGNQLNMTYDGSGRLQTIIDNLGIAGRTGLIIE